jgi:hypothetical protein
MKQLILSLLFILPTLANAQEVITSYDNSTLAVLNESLRQSSTGISSVKKQIADLLPIDLASSAKVTGVLPIANGGTGGTGGGVPSGGIIMWSGTIATIPTGWVLCNGSNGTPDLRNRFIVAADADSGGVAKSTVTGSALQTSDGVMPAHTHSVNMAQGYDNNLHSPRLIEGDPTPTTDFRTNSTGSGTKNIAVFYALAYIMKT